jgi:hypothetical protein
MQLIIKYLKYFNIVAYKNIMHRSYEFVHISLITKKRTIRIYKITKLLLYLIIFLAFICL